MTYVISEPCIGVKDLSIERDAACFRRASR